jgi:hypothetical protein
MQYFTTPDKQTMSRILLILIASAMTLALAVTVALWQPARAADRTTPRVPDNIQVPEGNELFLVGHAVGTQNYICLPSETGVKFVLFTPQATLFNDVQEEVITHYFSPNPAEDGTIRATWQDSRDTSTVWAQVEPGHASSAPAFVKHGAVPWLLLTVVGSQDGPTGGETLTATTFIQRLNTRDGVAPSEDCSSPADVGRQAFVPYTADYLFYKKAA